MRIDMSNIESVLASLGAEAPSFEAKGASLPCNPAPLSEGQDQSSEGVESAQRRYAKAHAKVERLLLTRDRSAYELECRLVKDGFDQTVVTELMQRCIDSGLVDDRRFADVLVRSRLAAGWGISGIERDLRKHRIDPASLDGFPEAYVDGETQYSAALRLLEAKPPKAKNLLQAAYGKLVRKGYDVAVARKVASDWYQSHSEA